ncbi:MAG: dATP/dGTP diphosphohydrolase domain-containing protein, partial [Natronospirillum sp.]
KARMELIPPKAEMLLAEVLTFGAEKYGAENWRLVDEQERRYMAAAMRHINAHRQGEVLDQESGLPHLVHAMCCLAFLVEGMS